MIEKQLFLSATFVALCGKSVAGEMDTLKLLDTLNIYERGRNMYFKDSEDFARALSNIFFDHLKFCGAEKEKNPRHHLKLQGMVGNVFLPVKLKTSQIAPKAVLKIMREEEKLEDLEKHNIFSEMSAKNVEKEDQLSPLEHRGERDYFFASENRHSSAFRDSHRERKIDSSKQFFQGESRNINLENPGVFRMNEEEQIEEEWSWEPEAALKGSSDLYQGETQDFRDTSQRFKAPLFQEIERRLQETHQQPIIFEPAGRQEKVVNFNAPPVPENGPPPFEFETESTGFGGARNDLFARIQKGGFSLRKVNKPEESKKVEGSKKVEESKNLSDPKKGPQNFLSLLTAKMREFSSVSSPVDEKEGRSPREIFEAELNKRTTSEGILNFQNELREGDKWTAYFKTYEEFEEEFRSELRAKQAWEVGLQQRKKLDESIPHRLKEKKKETLNAIDVFLKENPKRSSQRDYLREDIKEKVKEAKAAVKEIFNQDLKTPYTLRQLEEKINQALGIIQFKVWGQTRSAGTAKSINAQKKFSFGSPNSTSPGDFLSGLGSGMGGLKKTGISLDAAKKSKKTFAGAKEVLSGDMMEAIKSGVQLKKTNCAGSPKKNINNFLSPDKSREEQLQHVKEFWEDEKKQETLSSVEREDLREAAQELGLTDKVGRNEFRDVMSRRNRACTLGGDVEKKNKKGKVLEEPLSEKELWGE